MIKCNRLKTDDNDNREDSFLSNTENLCSLVNGKACNKLELFPRHLKVTFERREIKLLFPADSTPLIRN